MIKKEYAKAIPLLLSDIAGSKILEPKNSLASMMELAECYYQLGQMDMAKLYCDSVDALEGDFDLSYRIELKFLNVKALVYDGLGKSSEAIRLLRKIISIIETRDREIEINQSNVLGLYMAFKKNSKLLINKK